MSSEDHPVLTGAVRATPNFFGVLRVTPLLGSVFRPEHGIPGNDNVVVLTWAAWRRWFREDPSAIGKTIRIRDQPLEVIGVLPPDFVFPNANELRAFSAGQAPGSVPDPAVFMPAALVYSKFSWSGDFGNWVAIARTKAGIPPSQAQADLEQLQKQILNEIPPIHQRPTELRVFVKPMHEAIVSGSRRRIWLLMAAVLALLLIACLNLANTQLARAVSRSRETGVRAGLGAPRWRLLWSAMSESVLLALVGGISGVAFSFGALEYLRRQAAVDLPRLAEVEMNWFVLAFALAITVGTSLLFGFLPALRALEDDPQRALQSGGGERATSSAGSQRAQLALVAVQVFGCVVLMMVTALFARSMVHLTAQDKGFETDRVAFVEVALAGPGYGEAGARTAFVDGVLEALRATPGIESAAWGSTLPLGGESWVEDIHRTDGPEQALINLRWVSASYFETNRHRLVAGRWFDERDRALDSVVISQSTARALWPGQDAAGRKVRIQGKDLTVIGVVADARTTSLKSQPAKMAYLPHTVARPSTAAFFARSDRPSSELVATMREAVWRRDPQTTIVKAGTMEDRVDDSLRAERFQTFVLMAFGGTALLLAMVGIHGVLSYSMAARQREIGLRMALGATRAQIYRLASGRLGVPVAIGLIGGIAASFVAARAIRTMLYGVSGLDGALLVGVSIVFLACALAAGFLPARRAAMIDPMQSLRAE